MAENGRHRTSRARRQLILDTARGQAEAGGWASVTTRALSQAIGFSQPVLYQHFPGGKSDIMRAVALTGFAEIAETMRAALDAKAAQDAAGRAVATAYLDFAAAHPAVYEAMFSLPIGASFGQDDPEPELLDAFEVLLDVVTPRTAAEVGAAFDTDAEVFWAALHGLSTLDRAGRLRPAARAARIQHLAARFAHP